MFKIVSLNPYTAEVEGIYLDTYASQAAAITAAEEMIQDAKELPYDEPYLYGVFKIGAKSPVFVGGFSGNITYPIPEFCGGWSTLRSILIDEYGTDADFLYDRYIDIG